MKNKKKHLQKEERFFIEKMIKTNKSLAYISKLLDRGISTISEEVSRNGGRDSYNSNKAQFEANKRQSSKKLNSNKIIKNNKLKKQVDRYLSEGLSPEAVSKMLKNKKTSDSPSPKSVRKYLRQIRT
ncbi:MAG: hypothetical protein CEO12_257 [Parcubacteria group bacterium Gr01-1014_46]|nr:MAG: hypothetical protein CEO12_257 [Parcubacteria group bacterium Gr01-1014_46]